MRWRLGCVSDAPGTTSVAGGAPAPAAAPCDKAAGATALDDGDNDECTADMSGMDGPLPPEEVDEGATLGPPPDAYTGLSKWWRSEN